MLGNPRIRNAMQIWNSGLQSQSLTMVRESAFLKLQQMLTSIVDVSIYFLNDILMRFLEKLTTPISFSNELLYTGIFCRTVK